MVEDEARRRCIKSNLRNDACAGFIVFETSSILVVPKGEMHCLTAAQQTARQRAGSFNAPLPKKQRVRAGCWESLGGGDFCAI
jgi:hypothetical protein